MEMQQTNLIFETHATTGRTQQHACSGIMLKNNEHQLENWAIFNTAMDNYVILDPENLA